MVASKMEVLCVYYMNMGLKAREVGAPTLLVSYFQFLKRDVNCNCNGA
jgi:hypothetical protein